MEEGLDGDLVRGVEGDAVVLAGCGGLIGEAEAGEANEVGWLEVEAGESGEVEGEGRFAFDGDALGPGESVEDGQAHVGDGDLGEDAAVDVFDEGVDGGLRMDGDPDAVGREVEEAAGLDDLQALVEHGGGVYGDALAHDPGGMFEGLRGGDVLEVCKWGVAKGATGGGEPDLFDLVGGAAAEALVDGVVLGVDGEEIDGVLAGGGEDEIAGGDEALLVSEADGFAAEDGGVGGFEAGDADDGGDDEVGVGMGGYADRAGCAVDDFYAGDGGFAEARGERVGKLPGGDGDELRPPAFALGEGNVEVGAGGQGYRMKAVRVGLAEAEGALADGAGRAEESDLLHSVIFAEVEWLDFAFGTVGHTPPPYCILPGWNWFEMLHLQGAKPSKYFIPNQLRAAYLILKGLEPSRKLLPGV